MLYPCVALSAHEHPEQDFSIQIPFDSLKLPHGSSHLAPKLITKEKFLRSKSIFLIGDKKAKQTFVPSEHLSTVWMEHR